MINFQSDNDNNYKIKEDQKAGEKKSFVFSRTFFDGTCNFSN